MIRECKSREEWDAHILQFDNYNITQCWDYGEALKVLDPSIKKIKRIISGGDNPGAMQVIFNKSKSIPLYNYSASGGMGGGPLYREKSVLEEMAKKAGFSFKMHLYFPEYESPGAISGFSCENIHTAELMLENKDAIWENMEKETRNMIRRAAKENITVGKAEGIKDLEGLHKIRIETLKRTGMEITGREMEYFKYCDGRDWNTIYVAKKDGEIVGGFVLLKAGKKTHYSTPATNDIGRKFGASNLLIWNGIEDSAAQKYSRFDFWGIVVDKDHPQYSITRFKKSFNPIEVRVDHFFK